MKLFHGSNMEIDKVDLSKCLPNKDFGCGFTPLYLKNKHGEWRSVEHELQEVYLL